MKRGVLFLLLGTIVFVGTSYQNVAAERYTGGSYIIDAAVGNSFGGASNSTSYELVGSGGESIIGQGSGGSYRLGSGYVAQLENSMELSVQPNGLVAYYAIDEGAGTSVRDSSSNALDGSATNTPTWATGQVGESLTLNGSNQDVRVNDAPELDLTGDFTVSAWIRPGTATQTANARVVSKFDNTLLNYMLAYDSAGTRMRFLVDCDTRTTITSTTTLTNTSNWYHILGVKSGTSMKLFINGAEEDSGTCSGTVKTNAANLGIGSTPGSSYYNGRVDEVKLFSRALNADEIEAEYDAGEAGNTAGLSFAGGITPGVSQTSSFDAIVATDAFGYVLAVNQNQDLTKGGDTISAMSGTVASPSAWSEGTTTGLGFTLYGTNATGLDAKWNSGANYAGFPGTATTIYTREGQPQGTKDVLNLRLRLDVASSQPSGLYTNVITTTGTLTP